MAKVAEILTTVSGTITAWLPIPTPWLSIAACSGQIYEQRAGLGGNFIAFDPLYGESIVPSAIPCLPTEVTSSWYQSNSATTTLLGPIFVCPGAYTGVETILIDSSTQRILCCPSSYTLNVPITGQGTFPSQCTSLFTKGQTVTYESTTPSGPWGIATTVVAPSGAVTTGPTIVYGMHVNGFNVLTAAVTSTNSPSTSSTVTSGSPNQGSQGSQNTPPTASNTVISLASLSSGPVVGIGVGVAIVAIAAIVGAFFVWRRVRKGRRQEFEVTKDDGRFEFQRVEIQELHGVPTKQEMDGTQAPQEMDGAGVEQKHKWYQVHELP